MIARAVQLFTRRISRGNSRALAVFFDVCHAVGERHNIDCNVTKQPHVEPSAYLETLVSLESLSPVARQPEAFTRVSDGRTDGHLLESITHCPSSRIATVPND